VLRESKDLQRASDFTLNVFLVNVGLIEEKPELFVRSEINPSEI